MLIELVLEVDLESQREEAAGDVSDRGVVAMVEHRADLERRLGLAKRAFHAPEALVLLRDLVGTELGTTEVLSNWDDIKRHEKSRTSVFDGIPRSMPALSYAAKVGSKASKVGFDWPDVGGAFPKIAEETAELYEAMHDTARDPRGPDDATADELGDLLFAIVNVARHLHIDPELALRAATDKFRSRFERVETLARDRSIDLRSAEQAILDSLWDEVKAGG